MSKAKLNALQARLDLLSVALAALAREVPADRVAAVQEGLWRGVEGRLDGLALSQQADIAVAADLGRLMCALSGGAPFHSEGRTRGAIATASALAVRHAKLVRQ